MFYLQLLNAIDRFQISSLNIVQKETHACSIIGFINGVHLIWQSLTVKLKLLPNDHIYGIAINFLPHVSSSCSLKCSSSSEFHHSYNLYSQIHKLYCELQTLLSVEFHLQ